MAAYQPPTDVGITCSAHAPYLYSCRTRGELNVTPLTPTYRKHVPAHACLSLLRTCGGTGWPKVITTSHHPAWLGLAWLALSVGHSMVNPCGGMHVGDGNPSNGSCTFMHSWDHEEKVPN
eukprot:jgi/Botrbrau1/17736/Bobra.0127s0001.1